MDLREGTRRLAMVLGVVGALFGGFVSALEFRELVQQRTSYKQFEQVSTRIAELGKQTQKAYPSYADMTPIDLGLKVVAKYPEYWPWITGDSTITPAIPKPRELNSTDDTHEHDPWDRSAKDYDWRVWGITAPDGQTFFPTPAPNNWTYLWIPLLPILGFSVPWGAVHSIGWVLKGFIQGRN